MVRCTPGGYFCSSMLVLGLLFIIIGNILASFSSPNGELQQWYSIETCFNNTASFEVTGRGTFDAYLMRPIEGWQPGSACPLISGSSQPIDIPLEEGDGFRAKAAYAPVLAVPLDAYSILSFEILDSSGATVLPASVYMLGPDQGHPWRAPQAQITANTPSIETSSSGCACSDTCAYSSDASCDDGGLGSEYNLCPTGTDCTDCVERCTISIPSPPASPPPPSLPSRPPAPPSTPPSTPSPTPPSTPPSTGRRLLFGGLGVAPFDESEAEAEADGLFGARLGLEAPFTPPPGSRRLLKGGSSGGGASRGSGGRSGTSGSARWGGASPTRSSYVAGASYSRGGVAYGGRSTYYVGGYHYYGGYRPYNYYYGRNVFVYGTMFYVIGYGGYGRSYRSRGCSSRRECNDIAETTLTSPLDRYELELDFQTPGGGSSKWPLTLRLHNLTTFIARGSGATTVSNQAPLYLNFVTSDGEIYDTLDGALQTLGWLLAIFVIIVMLCNRRRLFPNDDGPAPTTRPMAQARIGGRAQTASASYATASASASYATAYPQPSVAVASAIAMPAYPATAYPTQGMPVAYPSQAYPTQGQPVAQAYASYPPSPPDSPVEAPTEAPPAGHKEE